MSVHHVIEYTKAHWIGLLTELSQQSLLVNSHQRFDKQKGGGALERFLNSAYLENESIATGTKGVCVSDLALHKLHSLNPRHSVHGH